MKPFIGRYSSNIYSREVILRAAYAFIDRYYIHIDKEDNDYIVFINAKDEDGDVNIARLFENEMISSSIRMQVFQQTHAIREILLGRAMASTMIINDDEENETEMKEESSANNELKPILEDLFDHE